MTGSELTEFEIGDNVRHLEFHDQVGDSVVREVMALARFTTKRCSHIVKYGVWAWRTLVWSYITAFAIRT
jgi:hypothetical protein